VYIKREKIVGKNEIKKIIKDTAESSKMNAFMRLKLR
jgi:hypothetical protein